MLSVQGELQGFWPVPVRPAAAPLQSQTGFDHHHSNSATALTFIKYLLMFRLMLSFKLRSPLFVYNSNQCASSDIRLEKSIPRARGGSQRACVLVIQTCIMILLYVIQYVQYMVPHLEFCIYIYLSHCTSADLWMLLFGKCLFIPTSYKHRVV